VKHDLETKSIPSMNFPLPGGNNQLKHLLNQDIAKGKQALIIGTTSDQIVKKLLGYFDEINVIAESYDSLIRIKMLLKEEPVIKVKMMDFAHTDFEDKYFSLIYAQGSVSVPDRKDILKEMKRIISDDGMLSIGEVVSLKEPVAGFVSDIWEQSGLEPLPASAIIKFYESKGFEIVSEKDLSNTLNDFYEKIRYTVLKAGKDEKEQNKKMFARFKHESNAYLKLGGDKYIGFKSLIMRKSA